MRKRLKHVRATAANPIRPSQVDRMHARSKARGFAVMKGQALVKDARTRQTGEREARVWATLGFSAT